MDGFAPIAFRSSYQQQQPPMHSAEPLGANLRLRSACDLCHQGKIRCSGGIPCSTCQKAGETCVYSPSVRLGRPKGSKNKRTLMQKREREGEITNRDDNGPEDAAIVAQYQQPSRLGRKRNLAGQCQQQQQQRQRQRHQLQQQHQQQQQQHHPSSDVMSFELGADQDCDADFEETFGPDETHDLLVDPNLGLLDSGGSSEGTQQGPDDGDPELAFYSTELPASATGTEFEPQMLHTLRDFDFRSSNMFGKLPGSCSVPLLETSVNDTCSHIGMMKPVRDETYLPSPLESTFPGNSPDDATSFVPSSPSRCACLKQLVKLLYRLGELQYWHAGGFAVDSLLKGVQLAQPPWTTFMQCERCQIQQEVCLLFITSIRMLVSPVQKLNASARQAGAFSELDVSIGTFTLTGDAKEELIVVATLRALQIMASTLLQFGELTCRTSQPTVLDPARGIVEQTASYPSKTAKAITNGFLNDRDNLISQKLGIDNILPLLDTLRETMSSLQQRP